MATTKKAPAKVAAPKKAAKPKKKTTPKKEHATGQAWERGESVPCEKNDTPE